MLEKIRMGINGKDLHVCMGKVVCELGLEEKIGKRLEI